MITPFFDRFFVLGLLLVASLPAFAVDTDHDGLDDNWQILHSIAPFTGSLDPDRDGRPNVVESINWSNPHDGNDGYTGWGLVSMIDQNQDLLDDGWAAGHMRNNTPLLPDDDLDGDLRKNIEESIAGTNPWVADAPWVSLEGPLPVSGPDTFTLGVRTITTMRYRVETSTDMVNWSEHSLLWGDGLIQQVVINTVGQGRMFFRVELLQTNGGGLDTDGDGLLDWYENHVFGTDPNDTDSDDDGLPDGWEARYGLGLLDSADALADGDGDSLNNLDEYDYAFDPRVNNFSASAVQLAYDEVNRLTSVAPPSVGSTSFTYDREGNRIANP